MRNQNLPDAETKPDDERKRNRIGRHQRFSDRRHGEDQPFRRLLGERRIEQRNHPPGLAKPQHCPHQTVERQAHDIEDERLQRQRDQECEAEHTTVRRPRHAPDHRSGRQQRQAGRDYGGNDQTHTKTLRGGCGSRLFLAPP